jgi:hypothetical protein
MKMILIAASFFILTGCQSEIDKCVNDNIDGWEAKMDRYKHSGTPYPDKRTKAEMKGLFRLGCLESANRNKSN